MKFKNILLWSLLISTSLFANENNLIKEVKTKNCEIEKGIKVSEPLYIKNFDELKCVQFNDFCIILDDKEKKEIIELLKNIKILKD